MKRNSFRIFEDKNVNELQREYSKFCVTIASQFWHYILLTVYQDNFYSKNYHSLSVGPLLGMSNSTFDSVFLGYFMKMKY